MSSVKFTHKKRKNAKKQSANDIPTIQQPVVDVGEEQKPTQETDVTPINPVGFESGDLAYVRPAADPVQLQVPGQKYFVLSYVAPTSKGMRAANVMVKCSGCYASRPLADAAAKEIAKCDRRIDVFVVECYNFVSIPIPIDVYGSIRKEYMQERIDRIMHAKYKEVEHDRKEMESRVRADKQNAMQSMRAATGDSEYVPADHSEFIRSQLDEESRLAQEREKQKIRDRIHSEDITDVLHEMTEGENATKECTAESFAVNLLERLSKKRDTAVEKHCEERNATLQQQHANNASCDGYYNDNSGCIEAPAAAVKGDGDTI